MNVLTPRLEIEPQRELQSPHGRSVLKAGDLPGVSAPTVNTSACPVVGAEGVDRVIEHVEGVRAELRVESFVDLELLHHREVGIESSRSVLRVAANVTKDAGARIRERPGVSLDIRKRREVSEGVGNWIDAPRNSGVERTLTLVGTADANILRTLCKTGSPRQTAAPVGGIAQLPTAYDVIHGSPGVAQVRLSLSEGKLVHGIDDEHRVPVEIDRPPRDSVIDGVVVIVVVLGACIRVVTNELQAFRKTLVYFHLKRIVGAGSIVPVVVAQRKRDLWEKYATLVLTQRRTIPSDGKLI